MRTLLLSLLFSASVFAQVTFTITGTIPTAQFASFEAVRVKQTVPITGAAMTLSAAITTTSATSISVSAVPVGWTSGTLAARPATCTQQDPSLFPLNLYFATDNATIYTCVATNTYGVFGSQILIDSEAMDVSAFSGTTLTVVRAKGQTAAATHAISSTVNLLRYPSAQLWAKQAIRDLLVSVLNSDAAVAAQQAVIDADTKALNSLKTASVQ